MRVRFRFVATLAILAVIRTGCGNAGLHEEEIRFQSGKNKLVGTLIRPAGTERLPLIVHTHYSGKQTREANGYRRRAEEMAKLGIACFIYDRQGRGESAGQTGRFVEFEELARDAVAAVDALRHHAGIDSTRIVIAGHSQGGWVAPLAASYTDHITHLLVTSAPGITAFDQEVFLQEQALHKEGRTDEQVKLALDSMFADTPEAIITSWEPSQAERNIPFFLFDPIPVWRTVTVPVLAIWGRDDAILPARKCHDLVAQALDVAGNANVQLELLPGVDHEVDKSAKARDIMSIWLREQLDLTK